MHGVPGDDDRWLQKMKSVTPHAKALQVWFKATMGDKGGKKDKEKSQKQNLDKHRQKANEKLKKQQKGQPELGLPHKKL